MKHNSPAYRIANRLTPKELKQVLQTGYYFDGITRYGEGQFYPIRLDDEIVEDIFNVLSAYLVVSGYDDFKIIL